MLQSIRHFRDELDTYQTDFFFRVVSAKLAHGIINLVRS